MHLDPQLLEPTPTIDSDNPEIVALARSLTGHFPRETVRSIFEYVRDRITHPADTGGTAVPLSASETLRAGEGVCYMQSVLLVALYRAAGIPAALRYQAVETEMGQPVLHGIAAVWAPDISETGGFLLVDPRYPDGHPRHSGHDWQTRPLNHPFERNLPQLHADLPATLLDALQHAADAQELLRSGLPATLP